MLLSIININKKRVILKKNYRELLRKIYILYKNIDLINIKNKNYISIIILNVIGKYLRTKNLLKSLNKMS